MPKYKMKSIVIEAFQFSKAVWDALQRKEFPKETVSNIYSQIYADKGSLYINIMGDRQIVADGDYIITGVNGEVSLCKPVIFEDTYEEV